MLRADGRQYTWAEEELQVAVYKKHGGSDLRLWAYFEDMQPERVLGGGDRLGVELLLLDRDRVQG